MEHTRMQDLPLSSQERRSQQYYQRTEQSDVLKNWISDKSPSYQNAQKIWQYREYNRNSWPKKQLKTDLTQLQTQKMSTKDKQTSFIDSQREIDKEFCEIGAKTMILIFLW